SARAVTMAGPWCRLAVARGEGYRRAGLGAGGWGFGIRDSGFAKTTARRPRVIPSAARDLLLSVQQIPRCARDDRKYAFPESRIPNPAASRPQEIPPERRPQGRHPAQEVQEA